MNQRNVSENVSEAFARSSESCLGSNRRRSRFWIQLVVSLAILGGPHSRMTPAARASDPVDAGYRDFSYGSGSSSTPTGEKPESKLWWNDDFWWASLFNSQVQDYHIYRLDLATQNWVDTGTALDDRADSKADTLWDEVNQKLYVVSRYHTSTGQPTTSASRWGRLYRYSYSSGTKTYTLDAGFPAYVTRGKSETLTLAKDSFGRLWVTYVEDGKVVVNCSRSSDSDWGVPFVLPLNPEAVTVSSDDISAIVSFPGNKTGVMWSNQLTSKVYFAVHVDGDADTVWQPEEIVLPDSNCTGASADDHINLKAVETDGGGRVFAAIKTSLTASTSPRVMLLVRDQNGSWSSYVFGRVKDAHTRPVVLLDEQHGRIYIFATIPEAGGAIYYKASDIKNPQFPVGQGDPLIKSSTDLTINNATSTKQNLGSTTGLVVMASDQKTRFYLHGFLALTGSGIPVVSSFTPTDGPVGAAVTMRGSNFTGATAVSFNGSPAASYTVLSDAQIDTTVPVGAATGKIAVSNAAGTGSSIGDFTVTVVPAIASFLPTSGPVGTAVTIAGTGFTGATGVAFNGTPAAAFTVVSDAQINTVVPTGATSGQVSVANSAGTGSSASDFTVTAPPSGQAPPTIASFTPSSGQVGTPVAITGTSFTGALAVAFNGAVAPSFTVLSDTRIDVTVPPGAATGKIGVTNSAGTGLSASDFTVTPTIRIKDITFEGGSLTDPASGVDKVSGTVSLETSAPLKGTYSAHIPHVANSYLDENFASSDDLYVSLYLRLNGLPTADTRIAFISNAGTTIGNIQLRTNGSLRLRNGSTQIGSNSVPLTVGQSYRVGIHQKRGMGADGILEAFVAQGDAAFGTPFAATSVGSWTTAADRWRMGATTSQAVDIVADDIRLDAGSMPPPSTGGP